MAFGGGEVVQKSEYAKRKLFTLSDLFLLLFVLILFLTAFFILTKRSEDGELYAEISVKGECVKSISLSEVKEPYTITVEDTQISVSSDGVCFLSSPCKDKLCIERGTIFRAGESAVCLPQRVSLRIVSRGASEQIDAVAG